MADILLQTPPAYDAALTTELNSLADGATATVSAAITNGSGRYPLGDLSLILTSLTPTLASARIDFHISYLMDDATNYATVGLGTVVGTKMVTTGVGIKYVMLDGIALRPRSFKLTITNRTGVALASSGNTLKINRYGLTVA